MTASLLPNAKQTFYDANGVPLVGGSVYFYIPGTSTPKNTWQDAGQTTLNTNPVVLDSLGSALIYGSGQYRQLVKDVNGNTIWDQLTQDIVGLITNPATPGNIDNMNIGANTPGTGRFTTIITTGAVTLSPVNSNVTIAPSGTGTVNIQPGTVPGSIDNIVIGGNVPAGAVFTYIVPSGASPPPGGLGIYAPAPNTLGVAAGGVEVIQVSSTSVLIGFTAALSGVNAWLQQTATGGSIIAHAVGATTTATAVALGCYNSSGTSVGNISFSTTGTNYNTSSDKRIKTNVQDYSASGTVIDALQIKSFSWLTDPEAPQGVGVLAQDAYPIFPYAVTPGDDDPNKTYQSPGYHGWSVDYAKLVPVALAELKSLRARLAAKGI